MTKMIPKDEAKYLEVPARASAPIQHAAPRGSADRFAHSAGPGSWFVIRCLEEVENKTIWIVKVGDLATIGTNSCKKNAGKRSPKLSKQMHKNVSKLE